ncbi:hypothetical protein PI23P_08690 [Polaribacter irgensii 23-P]|uniref:Uncharacterized protein n=1 Tax=Polaribacter irgensii 23-P TaxID=313594 RepID=A4BZU7_9FLAO|nr:hypothetical protein PI23P_08690 [Polaribacter irgensii 23-P]
MKTIFKAEKSQKVKRFSFLLSDFFQKK